MATYYADEGMLTPRNALAQFRRSGICSKVSALADEFLTAYAYACERSSHFNGICSARTDACKGSLRKHTSICSACWNNIFL